MAESADGTAAVEPLPRRRFFDDMPDKGLFAFTAIVGFSLIIGFKIKAMNPNVIAALAVGAMILYGFIAYNMPAVRMRIDRLGDNFYYLGFIYTLASMAAALIQLQGGIEIEPILSSFGIALITTIVGVAGRVTLVQMRGEIDEAEELTRRNLIETSEHLKGQLDAMLRQFETFSAAMRQTAEETAKQSSDAAKKQIEMISTVAQAAAIDIKTAFDGNRANVKRLSDTVEKVAKAVDQANENFSRVELPTQRFEAQLDAFGGRLIDLVERLGAAAGLAKSLQGGRRRWYWPFRRK